MPLCLCCVDSKGRLWFGTVNGLTRYQSISIAVNGIQPELIIYNAEVDYVSIDDPAQYNLKGNKRIVFEDNQNNVALSFKSVDLLNPEAIRYRWKIISMIGALGVQIEK